MTSAPRGLVRLAQASGPDVELQVEGDEWDATYETPSGRPAVYDEGLGLFCYARLTEGRFTSTGVSVSDLPPAEAAPPHSEESPEARHTRAAQTRARRIARSGKEKT